MTIDQEKVRQKLHFMRKNLRSLKGFQEMTLQEFKGNDINEAAATRMLQVAIEAMMDICSHIIAREGWGLPTSYGETVELAARNTLIPGEMKETYKKMVRFRNRVVHLYDEVDPDEIYGIISACLEDFHPFMANVARKYLQSAT